MCKYFIQKNNNRKKDENEKYVKQHSGYLPFHIIVATKIGEEKKKKKRIFKFLTDLISLSPLYLFAYAFMFFFRMSHVTNFPRAKKA